MCYKNTDAVIDICVARTLAITEEIDKNKNSDKQKKILRKEVSICSLVLNEVCNKEERTFGIERPG